MTISLGDDDTPDIDYFEDALYVVTLTGPNTSTAFLTGAADARVTKLDLDTYSDIVRVEDDQKGDVNVEISECNVGTIGNDVIRCLPANTTANVVFRVDGVRCTAANAIANIAGSGVIDGYVANVRCDALTTYGVRIGSDGGGNDDGAADRNWRPAAVYNAVLRNITGSSASGKYGIICYSRYARIFGNHIENIRNTGAGDTEGIYTKAAYSVIFGNTLRDAGQTEGFINIKGDRKTDSNNNQKGHNVVCWGNTFHATDDYRAFATSMGVSVNACKILNDNVVFGGATIDGMNFAGVNMYSSEIKNMKVSTVIVGDSPLGSNSGAFNCVGVGINHTIRDVTVDNLGATGRAVRISGITSESDYTIEGANFSDMYRGIYIDPGDDDTLHLAVRNVRFHEIDDAHIYLTSYVLKSLIIEGCNFGDHSTGGRPATKAFTGSSGRGARKIVWRNNTGLGVNTTDATVTDYLLIPAAYGGVTTVTMRVFGTNGTASYCRELKAAYTNHAGNNATLIGSQTETFLQTTGTVTGWAATLTASSGNLRFRVAGDATNIVWNADLTIVSF